MSSVVNFAFDTELLSEDGKLENTKVEYKRSFSKKRSRSISASHDGAENEHHLMHRRYDNIEMKCFQTEVRGLRDMDKILEQSIILLDLNESTMESIVCRLLTPMLANSKLSAADVKSLIFANTEKTVLSEVVQGTTSNKKGDYHFVQSWLCSMANVPTLANRCVGIARLHSPTNLGEDAEEINFFVLILCPTAVKGTKTALETGRTFSTLFSNMDLRHTLLECHNPDGFKEEMRKYADMVAEEQTSVKAMKLEDENLETKGKDKFNVWDIGRGIKEDVLTRLPFYVSDFKDGVIGNKALQKSCSTTFFLYFSVILPAIAFGNLQHDNTGGRINVEKVMYGQIFGGILFALFAGQPLVVVMTTAPLVLFTQIILSIANNFGFSFLPFYAMVGIWNSFFLIIYSVFNLPFVMKYSTRSTEEIFSNFISITLTVDAIKHVIHDFRLHYSTCDITPTSTTNLTQGSVAAVAASSCAREVSLLYLVLMLGTVWLGLTVYNFIKTPYLSHQKRELLSDYALPVSVIVFSAIGSGIFKDVKLKPFEYQRGTFNFTPVQFSDLTTGGVLFAALLGLSLSILFFMDQNISAAMVNSPENKLKKGNAAYHWDLIVVAIINGVLSVFGLPFMHAVLPHSPLHVRCLADVETRIEGGYVKDIVTHVRETRITNILSNILIGISLFFLPYVLVYVPKAVLDGLFLYMAVTPLYGNQMFERVILFFTEQAAHPPNHIVKRVPQRTMHAFTVCQITQLLVLCVFGFTPWPKVKIIFPIVIFLFIPVRRLLLPKVIGRKFLEAMDPSHD